jgi:hypothetical protein
VRLEPTLVFYTILAILYSILFTYLWFGVGITFADKLNLLICYVALGVFVGGFFMIYEFVAILPTYTTSSPAIAF